MTPTEFLLKSGWKLLKEGLGKYRNVKAWDHPYHRHKRHGWFTTIEAQDHQRYVDKYGQCTCPREER